MTPKDLQRPSVIFIPWCAGGIQAWASKAMWSEGNEFRHRPATPTAVARTTTAQGPKRNVALGLVPSSGRDGSSPPLHCPPPSHFHPLMWPSQGHR